MPHGTFLTYLEEEFPQTYQRANEYMLIARRVLESKVPDVRNFYRSISGGSKSKALLLIGVSDDEIEAAQANGEFLDKPLEEVGEMSYRQLREELRKTKRDTDRARRQRDQAETKAEDLQETMTRLRRGDDEADLGPLTPLDMVFYKLPTYFSTLLSAIQDAPDEELAEKGQGMLSRIMQDVDVLSAALLPDGPLVEPFAAAEPFTPTPDDEDEFTNEE